jgi:hypothetical protein
LSGWKIDVPDALHLFTRLPTAKITRIKEFTPAEWVKDKAKKQVVAQAA